MDRRYLEEILKVDKTIEWSEIFKEKLNNLLEILENDEISEETEKYIENITELCSSNIITFDEYSSMYSSVCGIADFELEGEYTKNENKIKEIDNYIDKVMEILNLSIFEGVEYNLKFSNKSKSIYISTDLEVNDSNIEFFEKLNNVTNAYEYYSDYDNKHMIIRISDHDFGGNIDYSYRTPCISIIV